MKIVYNSLVPFKGFLAINLMGIVFVREDVKDRFTARTVMHESIHTAQMKELGYIGFYILYLIEWLVRIIQFGFNIKAYYNISFEREAFENENDPDYLATRKHFAEWHKNQ